MTPDDHAARARDLLRTADEILAQAIDENTERPFENPIVHQQVQTLALLAQVHATLSLHQPDPPPPSADAGRPSSGGAPNRGRIVPAPTRQPTPEPPAFTSWQRLSDADVADFEQPDSDTAAERDLLNTDGIDNDLPDLDEAADGPVEHNDYYPPPQGLPPDTYSEDDDDLPE